MYQILDTRVKNKKDKSKTLDFYKAMNKILKNILKLQNLALNF